MPRRALMKCGSVIRESRVIYTRAQRHVQPRSSERENIALMFSARQRGVKKSRGYARCYYWRHYVIVVGCRVILSLMPTGSRRQQRHAANTPAIIFAISLVHRSTFIRAHRLRRRHANMPEVAVPKRADNTCAGHYANRPCVARTICR